MAIVPVGLGDRSYDIVIENGLRDDLVARLAGHAARGRLLVVTDANVENDYRALFAAQAEAAGLALDMHVLEPGEGAKGWRNLEAMCDWLLASEIARDEAVVALGGGVVGDITGFAAAIVKRGCRFVQVPTTLLAQVDSSVGGKTAINARAGKNLIGAFHQPDLVLIDPGFLDTLPPREVRAGYAEVVKYGLIDDADFFDWCEAEGAKLLAGDGAARLTAIRRSVAAKARIVAEDERETSGRRALLNLGHTFGHALEADTGFSDRLLHGEAVAAGMVLALRYSARRGLCGIDEAERVAAHLAASGLPTTLAAAGVTGDGATLTHHMLQDKKKSGGTIPFLLARGIGQTFLARDVDLADVAAFLDEEMAACRAA